MNGKYLLDTNIVIALFANDSAVKDNLAQAAEVFVPSIVIGELCFGARKSARAQANLKRIDEFIANSVVLGCDVETARRYGEIKDALRIKGRPIPENDIWIAAVALQHELTLTTRDAHFDEIENLKVTNWQ
ncbi:MAG: type II toxin-antitoxin system VapC family toxin [Chloroflexi bacterium]|nr:type II toxin-antitoxin system VapC family toxin [Chloroflexota bacterium]